jgi:metal-dependent amidase/aminoacylase/carboxypeptidase family protein
MEQMKARFLEIVSAIAAAHQCRVAIDWLKKPYPVLSNEEGSVALFEDIARQSLGTENVRRMAAAVMGGEDFAFYAQKIPACFFVIGLLRPGETRMPGLHDPSFDFRDEAIATGVELFCQLALRKAG